jgi:threonine dehydrogenase-like Zn-dependent dehydrogenase
MKFQSHLSSPAGSKSRMRGQEFADQVSHLIRLFPFAPTRRSKITKSPNLTNPLPSDLHEYLIGPKNAPTHPHILTGEALPSVLGHEFSGTIAALASDVTDLSIGQKVAVFPVLGDGTCHYCQHEILGMCPKWGFLGYSGYGGGMAEYVCVERRAIHKLPESMSLEVGALVEPLAVAWHAVKLKTPKPGDVALVLGAGMSIPLCLFISPVC